MSLVRSLLCAVWLSSLALARAGDAGLPLGPSSGPQVAVEPGDLVFRHRHGLWSAVFRDLSADDKRYSHVGIAIGAGKDARVVHAVADDLTGRGHVQAEPLAAFLGDAQDWAIYRASELPRERERLARAAVARLGVPFDLRFDLSTRDALYCSELVYTVVREVLGEGVIHPSRGPDGRAVVTIEDCYLGPRMRLVARSHGSRGPQLHTPRVSCCVGYASIANRSSR